MTLTLPHWLLTLCWWSYLVISLSSVTTYLARIFGHRWSIEPPKSPFGRAWLAILFVVIYTAFAIVMVLARRAL